MPKCRGIPQGWSQHIHNLNISINNKLTSLAHCLRYEGKKALPL